MQNIKQTLKKHSILVTLLVFSLILLGISISFNIYRDQNKYNEVELNKSAVEITKLGAVASFIEGPVEYKKANGGWFKVEPSQDLYEGYSIRTLQDAKAILILDDGSALRLNSDSMVTLVSLDPSNLIIRNDGGEIYSRVAESDRTFKVMSASTTYTALGTAFSTINTEDVLGVNVYESKVRVDDPVKIKEEVVVEEGKKYMVETIDPSEKQVLSDLKDEDLQTEFVEWNAMEDSKNLEYKNKLGVLGTSLKTKLEILSPVDGFETNLNKVTIVGVSNPTAQVFVNDSEVKVNEGKFEAEVALVNGTNEIKVRAVYPGRTETVKALKVIFSPLETKTPVKPKETTTKAAITLVGESKSDGIYLSWTVANVSITNGFKIVFSKTNANPTFGIDSAKYLSNNDSRNLLFPLTDGKEYNFRVCRYTAESKCDNYSNSVKVKAPYVEKVEEEPVSKLTSLVLANVAGVQFSWTPNINATSGYKLVWSKNINPTYPNREGDHYVYISNPEVHEASIEAKDGAGKYFVRVCEYLGGKCGLYSNQIEVDL